MNELEIYKFITENNIECHWEETYHNVENNSIYQLFVWIPPEHLREFCALLGYSAFDDGGDCETTLCYNGYIYVSNLDEVLELYGIDAEKVFPRDKFK